MAQTGTGKKKKNYFQSYCDESQGNHDSDSFLKKPGSCPSRMTGRFKVVNIQP
jgi:hypothetical protein